MKILWGFACAAALASCAGASPERRAETDFDTFYQSFKGEVSRQGLDPALLDRAFAGQPAPLDAVVERDRNQVETRTTFQSYLVKMLVKERREKGVALLAQHRTALERVEAQTGVPPEVIVALWGIESNFGANTGGYPVIPALVTLAWESNRRDYFANEAMNALRIADKEGMNPRDLTGSWAGAMGQCQFMPSNYLKHARDGNGDGHVDIWNTEADVFASAGNFLQFLGWQRGKPWRMRAQVTVKLPEEAGFNDRGLSEKHSISQWQRWGVVPKSGSFARFGGVETQTRAYRPLGEDGPTYMLGENYDVILDWNRSSYFATSVLLLAESIANGGDLPGV